MPTDDAATSATAALEALERALEESNHEAGSDEEHREEDEDARANAPDPNYKPPPPIPLPDPASLSSILRTDSKKDEKKASRKRVSFTAKGVEGAEEGKDEEGAEKRVSAEGEAPVLFKDYSVKSDMNKAGQARARRQAPGLSSKLEMEDENLCAYPFIDEHHALFCVFDGHAGRDCAVDAKKHFPLEMASLLDGHLHDTNVAEIFKAAYARTDQKLTQHEYMGATATTVYLWTTGADRYLQCANVGDSTAFLCRNGVAEQLSVDHKASAPAEKERIRALGIEISDSQNRIAGLAVSRALGDHFTKQEKTGITGEPTVSAAIKLLPTDTILILASDGLWDVMSGQAAVDLVKNMPDAEQMCTTLITTALRLPKCRDNITVIVVRL